MILSSVNKSQPNYLLKFVEDIRSIYESSSTLHEIGTNKLLFRFEYTKEAALHNAIVLQCYNFDLNSAIQAQTNSQVFYGSEFCAVKVLEKLPASHPLWEHTASILASGANFPLHPILLDICQHDIQYHKERGNHKSASKFKDILSKMIQEDVEHGFALPLPIEILPHIPNASIAPLGCQEGTNDHQFIRGSGSKI